MPVSLRRGGGTSKVLGLCRRACSGLRTRFEAARTHPESYVTGCHWK